MAAWNHLTTEPRARNPAYLWIENGSDIMSCTADPLAKLLTWLSLIRTYIYIPRPSGALHNRCNIEGITITCQFPETSSLIASAIWATRGGPIFAPHRVHPSTSPSILNCPSKFQTPQENSPDHSSRRVSLASERYSAEMLKPKIWAYRWRDDRALSHGRRISVLPRFEWTAVLGDRVCADIPVRGSISYSHALLLALFRAFLLFYRLICTFEGDCRGVGLLPRIFPNAAHPILHPSM